MVGRCIVYFKKHICFFKPFANHKKKPYFLNLAHNVEAPTPNFCLNHVSLQIISFIFKVLFVFHDLHGLNGFTCFERTISSSKQCRASRLHKFQPERFMHDFFFFLWNRLKVKISIRHMQRGRGNLELCMVILIYQIKLI